MKNASTEHLIVICQTTGDQHAFNELFARHDQALKLFLYHRLGSDNIDDIVQETYVKAFLKIKQFDGKSKFTTWLYRIAFNEFLQLKRKTSIFTRLKERWQSDSERLLSSKDSSSIYIDAQREIERLSSIQQQVFVYAELYEHSHTEISELLKIPLGSVKTYLKQAREQIRVQDDV
ncbi:RNA polymerase sigma factor [Kangiella koreensis]|uniref:RNA polymerase sigma factor n=1 Tax=Kangiella koreensis (strain DSM 16069 / JCM 12317 / KCTC 12182 / SW-125) TaxID=523791 RepID=C7RBL9_KANKD|nr:RNA polymerase sigma factor [Kangiella koreensis]ACV26661.1 RNA polymerase, sigma-24 subunit, ECF subfamily [Kangiella koreensis DSM 16069]